MLYIKNSLLIGFILISSGFLVPTDKAIIFDSHLATHEYYMQEASQWILQFAQEASQIQLQVALNIAYLSWLRSQSTLITQDIISKAGKAINNANHIFSLGRLNPALYDRSDCPLANNSPANQTVNYNFLENSLKSYTKSLARHQKISLTYDYAIQHMQQLENNNSMLDHMRSAAQNAVALAFASSLTHLDQTIGNIHNQLIDAVGQLSSRNPIGALLTKKGVFDRIWRYIKSLFAQAINSSDKTYSDAMFKCSNILLLAHDSHSEIWKLIETIRSAFYHAYYKALYQHIKNRFTEQAPLQVIFCYPGSIFENCTQKLPEPNSLLNTIDLL